MSNVIVPCFRLLFPPIIKPIKMRPLPDEIINPTHLTSPLLPIILLQVELATTSFIWFNLHLGGRLCMLTSWEAPTIFDWTSARTACTWKLLKVSKDNVKMNSKRDESWYYYLLWTPWRYVLSAFKAISTMILVKLLKSQVVLNQLKAKIRSILTWSRDPPMNNTLSSVFGKYSSFLLIKSLGATSLSFLILSPPLPRSFPAIWQVKV